MTVHVPTPQVSTLPGPVPVWQVDQDQETQRQALMAWLSRATSQTLDSGDPSVKALVWEALPAGVMWKALVGNPNLDERWWSLHGLNLAAHTNEPIQELGELARALGPRLGTNAPLVFALLERLATPDTFPQAPQVVRDWGAEMGVPSRDWATVAEYALLSAPVAVWHGSVFQEMDFRELHDTAEFSQAHQVWCAVMGTFRPGLIHGELDPPDFDEEAAAFQERQEFADDLLRCCGAFLWPQDVSVALVNDDYWRASSPSARWAVEQVRAMLDDCGRSRQHATQLVEAVATSLPPGACMADLVASVGDILEVRHVTLPAGPGRSEVGVVRSRA